MLKKIPRWYLVLVIVLFGVGLSFLFVPYHSYCEGYQPQKYYCAPYSIAAAVSDWIDNHDGIVTAAATIAIAWFTLSLRKSTDRLWGTTNRGVDLAREEFIADKRPWLSFGLSDVKQVVRQTNHIEVICQITIENVGRTPASDVFLYVDVVRGIIGDPLPNFRLFVQQSIKAYMTPGLSRFGVIFPRQPVTQDDVRGTEPLGAPQAVVSGSYHLFFCLCYRSTIAKEIVLHTATAVHLAPRITGNVTAKGFGYPFGDENVAVSPVGINDVT